MSAQMTISRYEELRRQVAALPKEIEAWKVETTQKLDMQAHFSQLEALDVLMTGYVSRLETLLGELKALTEAEPFTAKAYELVEALIKSQKVWDFFREKLELRRSATFREPLWVADTVAWDCYVPVMERAADEGIIAKSKLREPPLTYLTAELSPATFARGAREFESVNPKQGTVRLPIPIIELPWDHAPNLWGFTSIHHEVGHDIEADLKLRPLLKLNLETTLSGKNVPQERIDRWEMWMPEVFADLVGLQLAGPAFTESLLNLLWLPAAMVTSLNPQDEHPTPYVRILMNTAYIRTLVADAPLLAGHADEIEQRWLGIYGAQPKFQPYLDDFANVFKALMDTPLQALKGNSVRALMPYTKGDDTRIRDAVNYLLTGDHAPAARSLNPRHCVCIAQLAVKEAARQAANSAKPAAETAAELSVLLDRINTLTNTLTRDNTPAVLRGDTSNAHRNFIAGFLDVI